MNTFWKTQEKNLGDNDKIWSPKSLHEIVNCIELYKKRINAESKLNELDTAIKSGVVFGIQAPPLDLHKKVKDLVGVVNPPSPVFYASTEMSQMRIGVSKKATDCMNKAKREKNKRLQLSLASELIVEKLH